MRYDIANFYWVVGNDEAQVYSSKARAYLPANHPHYLAWVAAGGYATPIASEADLAEVFAMAGQPDLWHLNPRYVPVYLARQRLEAVGLWDDAAAIIAGNPSMMLKVLTLEAGIDVTDAQVLAVLSAIGADPAVILSP